MKNGLTLLTAIFAMTMFISSCDKDEEATCTDGIKNGTETAIDCGGDCSPCSTTTATCTDGIQNGTETGVDCGGTCSPCSTLSPYDNYVLYDGNYLELNKGYNIFIEDGGDYIVQTFLTSSPIDFISYNEVTDDYNVTGTGNIFWLEAYNITDELPNGTYVFENTTNPNFSFDFGDLGINISASDFIENGGVAWIESGTITISEESGEKIIEFNLVDENGKALSGYFKGNLIVK